MKFLFKGVDFFPHDTRWKIIERRYIFIGLSWGLAMLAAVLLMTRGLNYGVDFKGGSLIEVQSKNGPADLHDIRTKLNALGIGNVQIQSFGADTDVLIRVEQQPGGEADQQLAMKKVVETLGDAYTQRRVEVVGPAVSAELRRTGIIAVFASILAIIVYVWFRFEWQFAAGCVIALLHDVLVTVGLFSLLQLDFDLSIVAALLTILGYSVNDSVVVSDRIRENLRKFKRMPLNELLNISINETLSRTILTGMTAIAGILALLIFGGEVIRNFSFAMLFGIVIGTYSSVFIAAPLLDYLGVKRETVGHAVKQKEASAANAKEPASAKAKAASPRT